MPNLVSPLSEKVESLRAESVECARANKFEEGCEVLLRAWTILPAEKTAWSESFTIAKYLIQCYSRLQKFEEAENWCRILFACDPDNHTSGEPEFLAGEVAFKSNQLEKAKHYFVIAGKKSEGRLLKPDGFGTSTKEKIEQLKQYNKLIQS